MIRASLSAALAMLCLAAPSARAGAARDAVVGALAAKGLREGVNGSGDIVAVGVAAWPADGPRALSAVTKDNCFKIASIEARAEIIRTLATAASADKAVSFSHDGRDAERSVAEAIGTLASRELSGWRIVATGEDFAAGRHSVAVAVAWSPKSEALFDDVRNRRIFPAKGWRAEVDGFLKSGGLSGGGVEVFVDSSGYPHVLGVGRAEWDGRAATKNARASAAAAMARKNLLLALYGDAAVRESAERLKRGGRKGGARFDDVQSLYSSLADMSVSMPLPAGTRDLRLSAVRDGETGGKTFVSVFGFEPDPPPGPSGARERKPARGGGADGVKVLNPATGKFEKKEKGGRK